MPQDFQPDFSRSLTQNLFGNVSGNSSLPSEKDQGLNLGCSLLPSRRLSFQEPVRDALPDLNEQDDRQDREIRENREDRESRESLEAFSDSSKESSKDSRQDSWTDDEETSGAAAFLGPLYLGMPGAFALVDEYLERLANDSAPELAQEQQAHDLWQAMQDAPSATEKNALLRKLEGLVKQDSPLAAFAVAITLRSGRRLQKSRDRGRQMLLDLCTKGFAPAYAVLLRGLQPASLVFADRAWIVALIATGCCQNVGCCHLLRARCYLAGTTPLNSAQLYDLQEKLFQLAVTGCWDALEALIRTAMASFPGFASKELRARAMGLFYQALDQDWGPAFVLQGDVLLDGTLETPDVKEGIACYEHALDLQPDNFQAACALATALVDRREPGDLDRASGVLEAGCAARHAKSLECMARLLSVRDVVEETPGKEQSRPRPQPQPQQPATEACGEPLTGDDEPGDANDPDDTPDSRANGGEDGGDPPSAGSRAADAGEADDTFCNCYARHRKQTMELLAQAAELGEMELYVDCLWEDFHVVRRPDIARAAVQELFRLMPKSLAAVHRTALALRAMEGGAHCFPVEIQGNQPPFEALNECADRGYGPACASLAEPFVFGSHNCPKDPVRAREYARRGVALHDVRSMVLDALLDLDDLAERGIGPEPVWSEDNADYNAQFFLCLPGAAARLTWATVKGDSLASAILICLVTGTGYSEPLTLKNNMAESMYNKTVQDGVSPFAEDLFASDLGSCLERAFAFHDPVLFLYLARQFWRSGNNRAANRAANSSANRLARVLGERLYGPEYTTHLELARALAGTANFLGAHHDGMFDMPLQPPLLRRDDRREDRREDRKKEKARKARKQAKKARRR